METFESYFYTVDEDFTLEVIEEVDETDQTDSSASTTIKEEVNAIENYSTNTVPKTEQDVKIEEPTSKISGSQRKCHLCGYRTKQPKSLNAHVKMHSDPRNELFKCKNCDYATFSKSALTFHRGRCSSNSKKVKCPHCSFTAVRHKHIKLHIANIHNPFGKSRKCEFCGLEVADLDTLKSHKMKEHRNVKQKKRNMPGNRMVRCEHCEFKTTDAKDMRQHVKNHVFTCDFCNYASSYMNLVERHKCKHDISVN